MHLEVELPGFSHSCVAVSEGFLGAQISRLCSQDPNSLTVSFSSKLEDSFADLLIHTVGCECAMLMPFLNTV